MLQTCSALAEDLKASGVLTCLGDEVIQVMDDEERAAERHGLLGGRSHMAQYLGSEGTLEGARCEGPRDAMLTSREKLLAGGPREFEVGAMPPYQVQVRLPKNWIPGEKVALDSSLGPLIAQPPKGARSGEETIISLKPKPEYRVKVPRNWTMGREVNFKRKDGSKLSAAVPEGYLAGDYFEVSPPAVMALVPRGARAGDFIVFRASKSAYAPWFRAQLGKGATPRTVVPVRLPAEWDSN